MPVGNSGWVTGVPHSRHTPLVLPVTLYLRRMRVERRIRAALDRQRFESPVERLADDESHGVVNPPG
jgi:hypothetical protein